MATPPLDRPRTRSAGRRIGPVLLLAALLLVQLTMVAPVAAQSPPPDLVRRGGVPTWVTPVEPDVASPVDEDAVREGVFTLLDDVRIHVGKSEVARYVRTVRKAVSAAGVEQLAELSIDVEPDYQKLVLHAVRIRRGGRVIDALASASIRTAQRESEVDRRVYVGTITAYVVLNDVRAGDVVDVAYTVVGVNPILSGRYAGGLYLGTSAPARRVSRKVIVDQSRPHVLAFRVFGDAPQPKVVDRPGEQVLSWDLADVPAAPDEDRIPSWYPGVPWAELSEFAGWDDVVAWALPLYAPAPPASVRSKAEEIRQATTGTAAQALAAVRFVQDEVRYLSITLGDHSHRPNDPGAVIERRFGDCKDKSLLLALLLRELGVEAWPAMVDSGGDEDMAARLPSPYVFDHVVVRATIEGRTRWIDATASNQGGTLETEVPASFGKALVIGPRSHELEAMPVPELERPDHSVRLDYEIDDLGAAKLAITTEHRGAAADWFRSELARTPRSEVGRKYLEFYERDFPGTLAAAPLDVQDDRLANALVVVERYQIPAFWKEGARTLWAKSIDRFTSPPRVRTRRTPLALRHPIWRREVVRIRFKDVPSIETEQETVNDEAFTFASTARAENDSILWETEYRSRAAVVRRDALSRHVANLQRANDLGSYDVHRDAGGSSAAFWRFLGRIGGLTWGVIGVVASIAVFVPVGLVLRRKARRWAFLRRREGARGDAPSRPLVAKTAEDALGAASSWRCACGKPLGEGNLHADWSEVRFGGTTLHLLRVTCAPCGTATRRYFRLAEPPPTGAAPKVAS